MKRNGSFPFILIFAALLLVLSFSKPLVATLRGGAIAFFAPLWSTVISGKELLPFASKAQVENNQLHQLQIENKLLKNDICHLEYLLQETVSWNRSFNLELCKDTKNNATNNMEVMPAKVIYRTSTAWDSSLWVNVGKQHNNVGQPKIVAINSPVIVGNSLVGVIDYVGERQSRICLLTDPNLIPSVRVVRGEPKNRSMINHISALINYLLENNTFRHEVEESEFLFKALQNIKSALQSKTSTEFLAKGELHGSNSPQWRSSGKLLKGIGFNCDYADENGPARDLRRGTAYDNNSAEKASALLKINDLLVTTGMDGIFPKGLDVAEIVHISPLKEGDYYYEILASPAAGNLDDLELVFILPPCGFCPEDHPSLVYE